MDIYQILPGVDRFQSLLAADPAIAKTKLMAFDGSSKRADWPAPLIAVVDNEKAPEPDIVDINAGNLVLHGRSWALLEDELAKYCEFLPVRWLDKLGNAVNVIGLSDCLDAERTKWVYGKESGKRIRIEKFEFHQDRIPSRLVFMIPEYCFQLLCGREFKELLEAHKITGLNFVKIWESQS